MIIGSTVSTTEVFDPPLDKFIADIVHILREYSVETYESCQGGVGHAFLEPTVRFHGDASEGLRALAICLQRQLPVRNLRRVYGVINGEAIGPWWELTFVPTKVD